MEKEDFDTWCSRLNFPSQTIDLIAAIRAAPPSRRVLGRAKNVSGIYPSRKMGVTIQFESHTVELAGIYEMEHDSDVLEFYDQPPSFLIRYKNTAGRNIGHYHTPDFFVLRCDGAGWEEWKTEKELEKLTEKYPERYYKSESGCWRCPPGEQIAETYGLKYRVRTDAELNPILTQNLIFLSDYFVTTLSVPANTTEQILTLVQATPGINISSVLSILKDVRVDDLYALITAGKLYVNLHTNPLGSHTQVRLFKDYNASVAYLNQGSNSKADNFSIFNKTKKNLQPNTLLVWDSRIWTLINLGKVATTVLPEVGPPIQLPTDFFLQLIEMASIKILEKEADIYLNKEVKALMERASPKDFKKANEKFHSVQAYLQGQKNSDLNVTLRTLRRWVKSFKTAEAIYGCGYVGLLPQESKKGNRNPKATPESMELLIACIKEHFETPKQKPKASVYRAYVAACEQKNIQQVSIRRFYQILQSGSYQQTLLRKGEKAAYVKEPWIWELAKTTPRHGDRPFGIVHIDHTLLDIELRSEATGRNLGRPWLTLMIDAYSRRILSVYLTFDPPSYRSCMMALRICVQRFGRFPNTVVVDGGKEFHSVYFDTILARYHCTKKTRPGGKPRFGAVIERLFGTTNTQFIYNLLGNTQASKQPRQLTPSVNPKLLAVWTLGDLYNYLTQWAYSIYDSQHHATLGMTPLDAYLCGLRTSGNREHRQIPYNEEFLMATRPSTVKGDALIQPGVGIKINYLYYWNDAFRNPGLEKTRVSVRYDPMDVGIAYAYVEGRWVRCISQYYSVFVGHTEKELLLAATEIRQLDKQAKNPTSIRAKRLADFLSNVTLHENLLLQRLRDLEGQKVLEFITDSQGEVLPASFPVTREKEYPLSDFQSDKTTKVEVYLEANRVVDQVDLSKLPTFGEYR